MSVSTGTILDGKIALVTAASRGIGRAISMDLARNGARVVLGVRDVAKASGLVAEIESLGGSATAISMDVNELDACRQAIDDTVSRFGRLDILVNNAGGSIVDDALDVQVSDFDAILALNVRSTFFISQYAAKHMANSGGGAVVNMASQAGLVALPGESVYCLSKAAVIHMTKCFAVEWGAKGIRVNAVAPTFIQTDGTNAALSDDAFLADTVERIAALHRIGAPEEVASAVTFLASPGASLITGHTLVVDGGWTIR
ncbi:MAG TPA: glucose 1-dehydrogenase [Thermomicrobiales bacterium]|nr:glucose 1-dehydrogenase [Thermomicrobiales bacterium]